jgi:hypothetical protein
LYFISGQILTKAGWGEGRMCASNLMNVVSFLSKEAAAEIHISNSNAHTKESL